LQDVLARIGKEGKRINVLLKAQSKILIREGVKFVEDAIVEGGGEMDEGKRVGVEAKVRAGGALGRGA